MKVYKGGFFNRRSSFEYNILKGGTFMCCNNIILRVLNVVNVIVAIALGIAAAILVSVGVITSATIPTLVFILLAVAGVIGLLGLAALFFPCSLKCNYTRQAICDYFVRIAISLVGVVLIGLVILALGLVETPVVTPIFVGLLIALFSYLIGTLLQFAYVTVRELCDDCTTDCNCGCDRLR